MCLGWIGVTSPRRNFSPVSGTYVIVGRSVNLPEAPTERVSPWMAPDEESWPPTFPDVSIE